MPKNSQMFTGSWEDTVKGQKLMPKICPVKVGKYMACYMVLDLYVYGYILLNTEH